MEILADFILVAGLLITTFILIQLFRRQASNPPWRLLLAIFFILFFVSLKYYSDLKDLILLEVLSFVFEDGARVILGPLLLLYVKSIFDRSPNLFRRHALHFVPFVVHMLLRTFPLLASVFVGKPIFSYLEPLLEQDWMGIVEGLYLAVYCGLSLLILHRYGQLAKENFSAVGPHDVRWIKHMILGLLIVISVDITTSIYELYFGELNWDTGFLTVLSMDILIIYLGYYGIRQARILLPDFLLEQSNQPLNEKPSMPVTAIKEFEKFEDRLEEIFKHEQPYLDEDLTLGKLAALIPTTDKKLSKFLNQHLGVNFYDLINRSRVEAVKKRIEAGEGTKYTLLAIAYECGFSSKSSFNRIFKKETGVSPSAYRSASDQEELNES